MKRNACLAGFLAFMTLGAAQADNLSIPAADARLYGAECGSCHIAFPPQLLTVADWRIVMAQLDRHYGDNASLDAVTRTKTLAILEKYAGSAKHSSHPTQAAGALPRISTTAWFKRKHHEVSPASWAHPKVKSAANCGACHTRAGKGSYREREIIMPDGRRWDD